LLPVTGGKTLCHTEENVASVGENCFANSSCPSVDNVEEAASVLLSRVVVKARRTKPGE